MDENTPRWNDAQVDVKEAVKMTLGIAIGRYDRAKHVHTGPRIFRAANKLRESYTDHAAESVYLKKYGETECYKNVKDLLSGKVWELESRVGQWEEALKSYWKTL